MEYLLIAFVTVLIGAVPFGPVNLSVIRIAIDKSAGAASPFILASGMVELLFALCALFFGVYIQSFLSTFSWVPLVIFSIFIVVGIVYMFRETHPTVANKNKFKLPQFLRGLLISLANPQVILFWIFAITYISQEVDPDFSGSNMYLFLIGVFATKILVLAIYARLGNFLKDRLKESCKLINRTLGIVFIAIGVMQLVRHLI